MPVIELGFPAGRFHATPWGRHVNEGAVEWPPSPWRILRALVATWYLKARSDVSETTVRELIHALASRPALFQLPGATLGHTRHFMPINEGKNEKRTKVFDSFIHLSGSLRIHWDVLLSAQQQQALALLCERLSYLGRAESLVEAKALLTDEAFTANAFPLDEDRPLPAGHELVRLLAPTTDERLQTWLAKQAIEKESALVKAKRGKALKARGAALPQNIFEALHADTGELQRSGWTLPPGGRLLDYIRPENCFDLEPVRLRHTSIQFPLARFAVSSAVLPRITRAVSVAERIHQTLLSRFPNGSAPTVFTGRTHEGIPLAGHRHAFILCEANGNRDSITHVNVFARDGFDAEANTLTWVIVQTLQRSMRRRVERWRVCTEFGATEVTICNWCYSASAKPARLLMRDSSRKQKFGVLSRRSCQHVTPSRIETVAQSWIRKDGQSAVLLMI